MFQLLAFELDHFKIIPFFNSESLLMNDFPFIKILINIVDCNS